MIGEILRNNKIISTMVTNDQMGFILGHLNHVLKTGVAGDVVELGCHAGTTSLFIRRVLDAHKSKKQFHVYDSFQGLPEISQRDQSLTERQYKQGDCCSSRQALVSNFEGAGLRLPEIHQGWFGEIPDGEYPDRICFAFFDGDLYSSIMDSFLKVYHRVSPGGVILVHDYDWDVLPGVKMACDHFLGDKMDVMWSGYNVGVMEKL